MLTRILDRYLALQWWKIFLSTALGFPLIAILFELTDRLDQYLAQGIPPKAIALAYLYSIPEKVVLVLPASVLFATVFSITAMGRYSELTAAKASGVGFHRLIAPVLLSSIVAAGATLVLGEVAPRTTRIQLELLGERERRAQNRRFNFVYRAEQGWVYIIRSLDISQLTMRDIQLEREGTGVEYPTVIVQAPRAVYDDSTEQWTLSRGKLRLLTGEPTDRSLSFDSLRLRVLEETPDQLLAEAKRPEEMRYQELGQYIDALERSGGDGRRLRVQQALKLAIPVTCIIIAIFGAPLAITNPRASGAFGIAVSLGTTIAFLLAVQLSQGVGAGGVVSPAWAAWIPNIGFGTIGLWMLQRAPS